MITYKVLLLALFSGQHRESIRQHVTVYSYIKTIAVTCSVVSVMSLVETDVAITATLCQTIPPPRVEIFVYSGDIYPHVTLPDRDPETTRPLNVTSFTDGTVVRCRNRVY